MSNIETECTLRFIVQDTDMRRVQGFIYNMAWHEAQALIMDNWHGD